jgi:probable phosphoglycerate mutase
LIVLRHGQTRWNATGRFQGQADPPLDQVGRREAEQVAETIATMCPHLLISSDLRRAYQTALALSARTLLPITRDARLREIDLGSWTGLDHIQAARRYPDEYDQWRTGADIRRGGGETRAEAGARAADALIAALTSAPAGSTVVAVAHGVVLQAAIGRLTDLGVAEWSGNIPHLTNGGWTVVPLTSPGQRVLVPTSIADDDAGRERG